MHLEENLTKMIGEKGVKYSLEKSGDNYIVTFLESNRKYEFNKNSNIKNEETEDVQGYIYKWYVGYNGKENTMDKVSSNVVCYLMVNDENEEEYKLVFKGKGPISDSFYWKINNIETAWTRSDEQSKEIDKYKSKITKVVFEEGITTLGDCPFVNCKNIAKIDFPSSIEFQSKYQVYSGTGENFETAWVKNERNNNPMIIVNGYLLDGMTTTGNIIIPENVKEICDYAFYGVNNITSVQTSDNIERIGVKAFYCCQDLKTFDYPTSLKKIEKAAFQQCTSLENIDLPEGLEEIGQFGFNHCTGFTGTKIVIPSTVKVLGNYDYPTHMFYNCGKDETFVEFEVPESSKYYKAEDGILYTKDGKVLVSIPRGKNFTDGIYTMPDTVIRLGELSFSKNRNISKLIISDNLIINEKRTTEEWNAGYLNYDCNSLADATYAYSNIANYDVKDTNQNYTSGIKIVSNTHEFGDTSNEGFILTKDGSELVAMPFKGTSVWRMLPKEVIKIRKNALYMYDHLYDGENFKIVDGMYSGIYFRINANTTDIDAEQLRYINWLAKDTTSRYSINLEIQGTNSKYEIVDNQYVEKTN